MSKPLRGLCTRSVEFRAADNADGGDGRTLEGYAAVFNQPTEINSWEGHFNETIAPGAFKKTLRDRKPVMQFDHGRDPRTGTVPIAAIKEAREDGSVGLYVKARMFDNPVVEPIRQAIAEEAISGMSFRFEPVRDEWRDAKGGEVQPEELFDLLYGGRSVDPKRLPLQRTIREVKLYEMGPVVNPAYIGTSVGVRSMEDMSDDELEAARRALVAEYQRTMARSEDDEETAVEPEPEGPPADANPAAESRDDEPVDETVEDAPPQEEERSPEETSGAAREGTPESKTPKDAALPGTSERENPNPNPTPKEETKVKTKAEIEARQAEIDTLLAERFGDAAERSLDEQEQGDFDGLVAERDANAAELKKIAERQEVLRGLAQKPASTERGSGQGGAPAFHKDVDPYDLDEIRMSSASVEDYERKLVDNAKRAIEKAKFPNAPKNYKGQRSDDVAAATLQDVDHPDQLAKRMLLTGTEDYERGFGKWMRYGTIDMCTPEERRALVRAQALGTDSAGGFAVPFQLDPTVMLTNAGTVNPIRELARIEQITGKQWQGVTSAGVTVSRGTEGSTAADNSFTLAQPTLSTNRVQGFVPFNIEVDLAWGALRSEITRLLVDGKQREEDSFFTGDGTGVNPQGVVGYTTGQTYVTTAGVGTFATADVYALQAGLAPRWEPNSSWVAHKAIYHKLRQFDTAGGAALWARIGDGQPPRLLDYPDYRSSAMSSSVATGNIIMAYGDFSQYLIVDRIGMNVELVPHLFDPANANRPTGQRGVYAVWMNNGKRLIDSAFVFLKVQ